MDTETPDAEATPEESAGAALESASRAVANAAAVTETHSIYEDSRWTDMMTRIDQHGERLSTLEERAANLTDLVATHEHEAPVSPAAPETPPDSPPQMEAPPLSSQPPPRRGLTRR